MQLLTLRRHTTAEAKVSVDRLHALVEKFYKEMSSRVQALEVLNTQKRGDAEWMSEDDTESLATIHARPPDMISEEPIESEPVRFDFTDDLQKSRVYRRNQAFRESVISAITNSVYSLGWSFFSDVSMAEVSDISVINLAITERETFNPRRSSQTWLAQPNDDGASTSPPAPYLYEYKDGQRTHLFEIVRKSIPANSFPITLERWPASTKTQQQDLPGDHDLPPSHSLEDHNFLPRSEQNDRSTDDEATTLTPPPKNPSNSEPPAQVQLDSAPQSHDPVQGEATHDEVAYPCKRCGEVCSMQSAGSWLKPPLLPLFFCSRLQY